ncbi:hypothetical protein Btru_053866 [Bulinus truncatus]|nr:hypothetical protein Btru_053866 [Bulinus truncatus]
MTMIAVGIGKPVPRGEQPKNVELDLEELLAIAGKNDFILTVGDYSKLGSITGRLINSVCVCFHEPIDIAIVIDSSMSMGSENNFNSGIEYIKKFLDYFYFNETHGFTKVAAVMYGERVYEETAFNFGTYNRKLDIMNAISRFKWRRAANSNTASGINYMINKFVPEMRMYGGYNQAAIVLTNGQSKNKTATAIAAARARSMGIKMVAVGTGPYYRGLTPRIQNGEVNTEELNAITGTYDNFVTVGEVRKTEEIQNRLTHKMCTDDFFRI